MKTIHIRPPIRRQWTDEEFARLVHMVEVDHLGFTEIGQRLGRGTSTCYQKYHYANSVRAQSAHDQQLPRASERAINERDRYNAALHARDLTATLCGDPPPGYSALDRKRSAAT